MMEKLLCKKRAFKEVNGGFSVIVKEMDNVIRVWAGNRK